jgi:uncharacterized protein YjbJ (UPF0337 family)
MISPLLMVSRQHVVLFLKMIDVENQFLLTDLRNLRQCSWIFICQTGKQQREAAMNKDIFEGKFKEISGEIKKKWGELTDDDIKRTQGNAQALAGLLQQKLGVQKEEATRDVSDILDTLERKYSPQQVRESAGERLSDKVNRKVDEMKDKIKH